MVNQPANAPRSSLERASFWLSNPIYLGAFACLLGLWDRDRRLLIYSVPIMLAGYFPVGWLVMERALRREPPREPAVRAAVLTFGLSPLWLFGLWPDHPPTFEHAAIVMPLSVIALTLALLASVLVPPLRPGLLRTTILVVGSALSAMFVIAYGVVAGRQTTAVYLDHADSLMVAWLLILMAPVALTLCWWAIRLGFAVAYPPPPAAPASVNPASP